MAIAKVKVLYYLEDRLRTSAAFTVRLYHVRVAQSRNFQTFKKKIKTKQTSSMHTVVATCTEEYAHACGTRRNRKTAILSALSA